LSIVSAVSAGPVPGVQSLGSTHLRIAYEVNAAALPLESVALWYTSDLGGTWQLYGYDQDLRSPAHFEAPGEGLYGFYLVVRNHVGESSPDPGPKTEPIHQILVDLSPPLLQAHSATLHERNGRRTLTTRWTAYDAHFGPNPITLEYRTKGDPQWRTMVREMPNDESFDWAIPLSLSGKITVRLTARDTAGNVSTASFSPVDIERLESRKPPKEETALQAESNSAREDTVSPETSETTLLPSGRAERAEALLSQARWHVARGEWSPAKQRLSELLTLVPEDARGLSALAEVYYRTGKYADALRAYHDVVRLKPEDLAAWRGRALAEVAIHDYGAAAASLGRILELKPNDAETQLSLGDVLLMMGRREEAREMWKRSGEGAPADAEVADKAARRLQIYPAENE
jgi:Flp pilus assembly protein TadD